MSTFRDEYGMRGWVAAVIALSIAAGVFALASWGLHEGEKAHCRDVEQQTGLSTSYSYGCYITLENGQTIPLERWVDGDYQEPTPQPLPSPTFR